MYMDVKEYDDAMRIWETIVASQTGKDKILPLVDMATCQIGCNQLEEASVTSARAISIIEALSDGNELNSIKNECDDAIHSLVNLFVTAKHADSIVALAYCRFHLVKKFYQDERKLYKLKEIGSFMEKAANVTANDNKEALNINFFLLDEILVEMQKVKVASVQYKCKKIVWFMKHYGYFCIEAQNHSKAGDLAKQAKSMLETVFSEDSNKYRIYGYLYSLLKEVYINSNQEFEARHADKMAFQILDKAEDEGDDPIPNKVCHFL